MTDFSLMLPTLAISFSAFLLVLVTMNQGNRKPTSSSQKPSKAAEKSYFSSAGVYDDSHYHSSIADYSSGGDFSDCGHHSSGADYSSSGDFGGGHFGGDFGSHCGGFDGGSH